MIPFFSDISGGSIVNPPVDATQGIRALELVNNIMFSTWRHNGNWRTQSFPSAADADGLATVEISSTDIAAGIDILYSPWLIFHISPQILEGVANARNSIRVRHDIGMQRSVDYKFEVQAKELHSTILYLGAEIVDTIAAYTGLTIGTLAVDGTRTTAAKRQTVVNFSGLVKDSQVYIDVPGRDHPLSEMLISQVLEYLD
jgi:hypothetical protein